MLLNELWSGKNIWYRRSQPTSHCVIENAMAA
jgi:hypothetical protein